MHAYKVCTSVENMCKGKKCLHNDTQTQMQPVYVVLNDADYTS